MAPAPIRTYRELESAIREKLNAPDCPTLRTVAAGTKIPLSRVGDFKTGKVAMPFERLDALAVFFAVKYRVEKY